MSNDFVRQLQDVEMALRVEVSLNQKLKEEFGIDLVLDEETRKELDEILAIVADLELDMDELGAKDNAKAK